MTEQRPDTDAETNETSPNETRPNATGQDERVQAGTAEPYDPTASSLTGHVDPSVMAELLSIRSSIDNFDATLVYLLAERFKVTQRVGFLKAKHQLPPADPTREAAQIARLRRLAEEAQLDPAFAEKLLNFIISEVIRHHQAIAEDHGQAQGRVDQVREEASRPDSGA